MNSIFLLHQQRRKEINMANLINCSLQQPLDRFKVPVFLGLISGVLPPEMGIFQWKKIPIQQA